MKLIIGEGKRTEREGTLMEDISYKKEKANDELLNEINKKDNSTLENEEKETGEKE